MAEEFRHILRIANTDLEGKKQLLTALRKIKGVNFMFANMVCNLTGVDKNKRVGDLSDNEAEKLNDAITDPLKYKAPLWMLNRRRDYETGEDKHLTTGNINLAVGNDIKRLRAIKSYRGFRHAEGLPLRGQKTKSNFRRNKGKVTGVKRKGGKSGKV
ncbi:30S ribosomal protein S13 [Candidatus Woesearchaeota archaeon]|nr:30S ribosomal protein S13 [Candidatus Woesearchaeota archaeon]